MITPRHVCVSLEKGALRHLQSVDDIIEVERLDEIDGHYDSTSSSTQ